MRKNTLKLSNQAAAIGLQFNVMSTELMEVEQRISEEDICINAKEKPSRFSATFATSLRHL